MSIIHEALKKTQSQLEQNQLPATVQNLPVKKENTLGLKILLSLLFLGFVGSAICFILFVLKSRPLNFTAQTAPASSPSSENAQQGTLTLFDELGKGSPSQNTRTGALKLNGIVAMNNAHMALINNQIYKEGDSLAEGQRILSISLDKVEIFEKGGKILVLENKK